MVVEEAVASSQGDSETEAEEAGEEEVQEVAASRGMTTTEVYSRIEVMTTVTITGEEEGSTTLAREEDISPRDRPMCQVQLVGLVDQEEGQARDLTVST